MSKLILSVLNSYNQQLTEALALAERAWPALHQEADETLTEAETEERRKTLFLAMVYLDQLQALLDRQTDRQAASTLRENSNLSSSNTRPAS